MEPFEQLKHINKLSKSPKLKLGNTPKWFNLTYVSSFELNISPELSSTPVFFGIAGQDQALTIGEALTKKVQDMKPNITPTPKPNNKNKELCDIILSNLFVYSPLNHYQGLKGKTKVRADTTYVGIEIELEKIVLKCMPPESWNQVEDNSLKIQGQEYVTVPIQFKYLEVELERLFGCFKSTDASIRCSVHVHLNVRDMSLEELKTFIALYMIFERSLYRYSGDRWNNNFCVPLQFYPKIVTKFINKINTFKCIPTDYDDNDKTWYKYSGLNLCPIFGGESTRIGTAEFRQMKGNTNKDWILNWINLIVSLKITAKKFRFEEIQEHIRTMNTTSGYYWLVSQTFKNYASLLTEQPTFKTDIEQCIALTKTIFCNQTEDTIYEKEIPCVG